MPSGLLIQQFAGCKILQDSFADEHTYRVVTWSERCVLETDNLEKAVRCAEEFSKAYLGVA